MNNSVRATLEAGMVYRLHGEKSQFECLHQLYGSFYSPQHTYRLFNVKSGWSFIAHGVNMYEDGSIDWDFSTDGYFAERMGI